MGSRGMSWEACWIREHLHLYESKGHAEAVILNIQKRLIINALVRENAELKKRLGVKGEQ